MSKLDELIQQLCPDGVEYKALGEFGTMIRGNGLQKKDFSDTGVGCIHYGQIYTYYGAFAYETKTFVPKELAVKLKKITTGDLVIAITSENIEDVCKCVAWLGNEEIVTGGHSAVFKHNQNPKYLAYCFQTEYFFAQKKKIANGTKVIEVSPRKLENIKIPVPPLPIQNEIVRILDNFTELTAELTAEHTARKKQYEYYRDQLLTFAEDDKQVRWMNLGNIVENIVAGKNKIKDENGKYPVYGSTGIIGYTDNCSYNEEMLLVARVGANAGFVQKVKGEIDVSDNTLIIQFKGEYDISFACHQLRNINLNNLAVGGGQPLITASKLKQINVPVPSREEQERIASILDRFDSLCNDITTGLPAEIEARRKQYEYYRDKLLTFKELGA